MTVFQGDTSALIATAFFGIVSAGTFALRKPVSWLAGRILQVVPGPARTSRVASPPRPAPPTPSWALPLGPTPPVVVSPPLLSQRSGTAAHHGVTPPTSGVRPQLGMTPPTSGVRPQLGMTPSARPGISAPTGPPADWREAERMAQRHMRNHGFPDARLTGDGADGGIDVIARAAVAQVKMQAKPVGPQVVRQLRGAKPQLDRHLFYSTSGYTKSALATADEIGVSLFVINQRGVIEPINRSAVEMTRRRSGA
ncbi:restriction endonuclease [Actinoplanes sp. HUAS TT8]|uniref:restriction endonuclease n=1 Tax=Actinoplanes sp. HUAS TT8 TaxID=3447453 RepID=UPI003F526BD7